MLLLLLLSSSCRRRRCYFLSSGNCLSPDAGGVQVVSYSEACHESQAPPDATLHSQGMYHCDICVLLGYVS